MTDEEKIVLGNGIYAVYVEIASGKWQEASGKKCKSIPLTIHHCPLPLQRDDEHRLSANSGWKKEVD
jgi:hypothetical protein